MSQDKFKIGGLVRTGRYSDNVETISKVTKTFFETKEGNKYSLSGKPWGQSSSSFYKNAAYPTTLEQIDAMKKEEKRYRLSNVKERFEHFIDSYKELKDYGVHDVLKNLDNAIKELE